MIDTAACYKNEKAAGVAVRKNISSADMGFSAEEIDEMRNKLDSFGIEGARCLEEKERFMKMRNAATTMLLLITILTSCMAAGGIGMERRIKVTGNNGTVVFELNGSDAADSLWAQLPFEAEVENFSNNEKIFYPENGLSVSSTPLAEGGAGTLAYYRPWGNVVMFYGPFNPNGSLYGLGRAAEGKDLISSLSGTIRIEKAE